MAKCYLVFEKKTKYELAVAVCYSIKELMKFLDVSRQHVYRLISGQCQHPEYGIYVDCFLDDEGGSTPRLLPPVNREQTRSKK